MKRITLFSCISLLVVSAFFIAYGAVRAGDSSQAAVLLPSVTATPAALPATALIKGSGKLVSTEVRETGEILLTVEDETGIQRQYVVPKDLTAQKEETEIQPSEIQKGDILDIDYSVSDKGDRIASYLLVVISADEKEVQVETPALTPSSQETPP